MGKKWRVTVKNETKIRVPVPKPGHDHGDKTKYTRKPKYPKKVEE